MKPTSESTNFNSISGKDKAKFLKALKEKKKMEEDRITDPVYIPKRNMEPIVNPPEIIQQVKPIKNVQISSLVNSATIQTISKPEPVSIKSVIPGFFDEGIEEDFMSHEIVSSEQPQSNSINSMESEEKNEENTTTTSTSILPVGFFDNPIEDMQVRGLNYIEVKSKQAKQEKKELEKFFFEIDNIKELETDVNKQETVNGSNVENEYTNNDKDQIDSELEYSHEVEDILNIAYKGKLASLLLKVDHMKDRKMMKHFKQNDPMDISDGNSGGVNGYAGGINANMNIDLSVQYNQIEQEISSILSTYSGAGAGVDVDDSDMMTSSASTSTSPAAHSMRNKRRGDEGDEGELEKEGRNGDDAYDDEVGGDGGDDDGDDDNGKAGKDGKDGKAGGLARDSSNKSIALPVKPSTSYNILNMIKKKQQQDHNKRKLLLQAETEMSNTETRNKKISASSSGNKTDLYSLDYSNWTSKTF